MVHLKRISGFIVFLFNRLILTWQYKQTDSGILQEDPTVKIFPV